MAFKKHKTSIIITIILASLIGLAVIQIGWLNKAIATNKQIFVQNMDNGAKQSGELYRAKDDLASTIHKLLSSSEANSEEIHQLIKPIIDEALTLNNLSLNYEYGIYKHQNSQQNKFVFGTTSIDILKSSECDKETDKAFGWASLTCSKGYPKGNSYHLAIFPSYTSFILNQVKYSLLAFIFFLALISFGIY